MGKTLARNQLDRPLTRPLVAPPASEEDIAQFTGITGGSVEQANFFIGSAGGNVEVSPSLPPSLPPPSRSQP